MTISVNEAGGALQLAISDETYQRSCGYESTYDVLGAFDAYVSFASFSSTLVSGAVQAYIEFFVDANNYARIGRYKDSTGEDKYLVTIYNDGAITTGELDFTAASGVLRIKRTGMTILCYAGALVDGQYVWGEITSVGTFSTYHGKIKLMLSVGAGNSGSVSFDNYVFQESSNSLYESHFVSKGKNSDKLVVNKAGAKDYKNKVTVQYTKRAAAYTIGTVPADDLADIDTFGLKDATISLDSLCSLNRADKMAWLFLRRYLMQPEQFKGILGPRSLGVKPGDIRYISDKRLELSNAPARAISVSEGADGLIDVEFSEEKDLYEMVYFAEDTTDPTIPGNLSDPAQSVQRLTVVELPSVYATGNQVAVCFSKPDAYTSWAGCILYKAYNVEGDYTRQSTSTMASGTGVVLSVSMAGGIATIRVQLDYENYSLTSAVSQDALFQTPHLNEFIVLTDAGVKFIRFQTAELVSAGIYDLSGLLYDVTDTPLMNTYGDVRAGHILSVGYAFTLSLLSADTRRTLYFKAASYNFSSQLQDLSLLTAEDVYIEDLYNRPLTPWDVQINSVGTQDNSYLCVPSSTDLVITWKTRNRYATGIYNYERTDSVVDDSDFNRYVIEVCEQDGTIVNTYSVSTVSSKTYTYTTAQQVTDGFSTGNFLIRLYQEGLHGISDAYSVYAQRTIPEASPSASPSLSPSASLSPSRSPSVSPSRSPSLSPSASVSPSRSPSVSPSVSPSSSPSISPSPSPSLSPSASASPSVSPSASPSVSPSASPSLSPSASMSPSGSPSVSPSASPSVSPSLSPSASMSPSISPSEAGSSSMSPSRSPSASPSLSPSPSPTDSWTIAANGDDGVIWSTYFWNDMSADGVGSYFGEYRTFLRFTNVDIVKDTPLTSATLKIFVENINGGAFNFRAYGNDVDNAAQPASFNDVNNATLTSDYTTVDSSTLDDYAFNSIDVTDILQHLITRAGWTSGNSVMFILKHVDAADGEFFNVRDYQYGYANYYARLEVVY